MITGEVLNDLSIPIYLNGQHWGALIMGFNPEQFVAGYGRENSELISKDQFTATS